MELKKLSINDKEAIKELFTGVFTGEPWNDDWSDGEQLDLYIEDLCGQGYSLTFGLYDGGELIHHPHVKVLETPVIEVSSTFIRNSMKAGKDVRHFMPEKAYQYLISSGATSSF